MGRAEEALGWWRRAVEADPADAAARAGLARGLLAAGHLTEAARTLREPGGVAEETAPGGDLRLAAARRDVALGLLRAGRWEEAAPWLARAAALEPWDLPMAAAARRVARPDWLAPAVRDPLTGRTLVRTAAREGDAYIYVIEVVGTCNLRCPTCPVGNSGAEGRPSGIMDPDLFDRIVDKILRESPSPQPRINLYNWGEPLLHPQLPRFVRRLREEGLAACLSTNLNIRRGLEAVLREEPAELKISLSGFTPATYARSHVRGDLALVRRNMEEVAAIRDRLGIRTRIWVGHHVYRSNRDEVPEVARACAELGFEHHPIEAFYMPLERLIDVVEGRGNPRDGGVVDDLLTHPAARPRRAPEPGPAAYDCELRFNQTVINVDGGVALCCTVWDAPNMLGARFLDEDHAALEARKYRHAFCATCEGKGMAYAPKARPREVPAVADGGAGG